MVTINREQLTIRDDGSTGSVTHSVRNGAGGMLAEITVALPNGDDDWNKKLTRLDDKTPVRSNLGVLLSR